ncbi:alpha/beta-hydrolase [Nemania sp. NC0429]|nr:alpha/beta-hydrolase [Nemania sp. NC0429]
MSIHVEHDSHPQSAPIRVESGLLSGIQLAEGRVFLGIPYAKPPVGDLRWKAPQRPLAWDGVRPANKFGPSSLQFPLPPTSIYYGGESDYSEDCLYLNVYTGAEPSSGTPVLVWLHFGAFVFGSAANPMYDGTRLAAQGITVVTVNYRLGRFGFLAHSDLSAESELAGGDAVRASGNYGIMDQIAALEWVQRNISAFGGDPARVTVGGASAGGASVHILRASPLAKGLFCRAICESGPGLTPVIDGPGHLAGYTTLAAAEEAGAELLDALGVSSIEQLRRLPAAQILAAHLPRAQGPWKSRSRPGSVSLSIFDTANPIVDGRVLPESPLAALASGAAADVPLLCGNVADEATGLPHLDSLAEYRAFVGDMLTAAVATDDGHDHDDGTLSLYPAADDNDVQAATLRLLADQVFVWPTWAAARLSSRRKTSSSSSPVWYYQIRRAPPVPATATEASYAGVFHCAGVPYALGTFDSWRPGWAWTDEDRRLSRELMGAVARFVTTGAPGDGSVGYWPPLEAGSSGSDGGGGGPIVVFGEDGSPAVQGLNTGAAEAMTFWDRFYGLRELL